MDWMPDEVYYNDGLIGDQHLGEIEDGKPIKEDDGVLGDDPFEGGDE